MDQWMRRAIDEAHSGLAEGGIPIGFALVRGDRLLGAGLNKRIQEGRPVLHAEIDCLSSAGRVGYYCDATLHSTLMPCYLCAGAAVQFGIKRVIVREPGTFKGARAFMESHGITVVDLDLDECKGLMRAFIAENPALCHEDIGELTETL